MQVFKGVLVSIIIPSYNAAHFIGKTLASVIKQTYPHWEAIVIDDGSTDNTREVVENWLLKDSRISYHHQPNSSQAVARNRGISVAQGEFIAFLDADDLWHPRKLEDQLPLFDQPNTGLTYTQALTIDVNDQVISEDNPKCYRHNVLKHLLSLNFIYCSSVIVRSTLIKEMDPCFRTGRQSVEDWDLWLRLALITEFDFVPKPFLSYRATPGSNSSNSALSYKGNMVVINDFLRELQNHSQINHKDRIQLTSLALKQKSYQSLKFGHILLSENKLDEARNMMKQAYSLNKINVHNWWGMIKSYLIPLYTSLQLKLLD